MASDFDVVVVGGGVAGLTAGTYAARYGLETAVIETLIFGNQIINVERIENFPGFPKGISGAELAPLMMEQATDAGATGQMAEVTGVTLDEPYKLVNTTDGNIKTKALIVAAGSSLKKLGIPGESELYGSGVSHCATCDGPMFSGETVGVVGGGDSAADEALTLTDYVDSVVMFHRGDKSHAQKALRERVLTNNKIDIVFNTVVESILGKDMVKGVGVRNVVSNLVDKVDLAGLFIYVGLEPNSDFLRGLVKLDNGGHIPVDLWMETEIPGIYAAGDIRQHSASQLASAAGDGATAAIAAYRYINSNKWPYG